MGGELYMQPTLVCKIEDNKENALGLVYKYWDYISCGLPRNEFQFLDMCTWYRIEEGDNTLGYFVSELYSDSILSIHVIIDKPYRNRKEEIVEAWKDVLRETVPEDIIDIIGVIPRKNHHAIAFAAENDFYKYESFEENGIEFIIMGILREEFLGEL